MAIQYDFTGTLWAMTHAGRIVECVDGFLPTDTNIWCWNGDKAWKRLDEAPVEMRADSRPSVPLRGKAAKAAAAEHAAKAAGMFGVGVAGGGAAGMEPEKSTVSS